MAATQISDEAKWAMLQRKAQEARAQRAFEIFRTAGIEPVLIKGVAADRYYPPDRPRISVDIDLAFAEKDYDEAVSIVEAVFDEGLAIDAHRELRHLDTLEWTDLYANSVLLDNGIRVLRPEDHLRVICVHWLTDGGNPKERLWDVYFMVRNRDKAFEWERFLGQVGPKRRRWLVCTLGLAQKYLGLDLSDTPVATEASDLPPWLLSAVERSWAKAERPLPLEILVRNPPQFASELIKKMRPDPIFSTIHMEGSFDAPLRLHYHLGSILKRIGPSIRRYRRHLSG